MAADYTITNQRQTSTLIGGQFQQVMEVTFQTATGSTGAVYIPVGQYTADAVKQAVEARVQVLNEVHQL